MKIKKFTRDGSSPFKTISSPKKSRQSGRTNSQMLHSKLRHSIPITDFNTIENQQRNSLLSTGRYNNRFLKHSSKKRSIRKSPITTRKIRTSPIRTNKRR